jgi:hypothetical protein
MKSARVLVVLLVAFTNLYLGATPAVAGKKSLAIRVGVYDSRLVALAWARCDEFKERIKGMKADLRAAKEAGDEETVARLEAEGPALQDQLHRQVFGNAPIPGIMEQIRDSLPAIAREAGVDMIVCKWDVPWKRDDIELVDVSTPMMMLFDPSDETLKIAEEARNMAPVPAEQLEGHKH